MNAPHPEPAPLDDWVSRLADEVITEAERLGTPVICASGLSRSGPIHLGNLREVMTPHLVADEVRRRGLECDHLISWDDYDRFRKVPAGIDGVDDSWADDEVAVSAVTIGELHLGVTAAADPLAQLYRRRRVQVILDQFDVLPFDVVSAEFYGTLAALVRQHGRNPRPRRMDLQIAATAARHGLTLLTRNGDDFTGLASALTVIDLPDQL